VDKAVECIAGKYLHAKDFMFLGRQALFPIALESALKLKEIAYVNATGYPSAEMKHGPIAMVHPNCPSMFFAPDDELLQKSISSMQEIKARGGPIIAVTHPDVQFPAGLADDRIDVPRGLDSIVDPILFAIPGQLFAYFFAKLLKLNVDRPKNLAKSVTVE
jgi:glucosamine--fructose-6-phosphate aminotransferase (isomerizing)